MRAQPSWSRGCWILLVLLLAPGTTYAQQAPGSLFADNQLWDFGVWGSEAVGKRGGEDFGTALMTMAGVHAGRVVYEYAPPGAGKRTLEYTIDLEPLFLVTHPQRAYGGGFAPVGLRWDFVPRGRYRTFVEFNGGGMFTQKNVPPGNTSSFNFTVATGPGVMIALSRNQALSIALHYWHLSNADMGNENPAYNAIQIVVGYHWLKARNAAGKVVSTSPHSATAKP